MTQLSEGRAGMPTADPVIARAIPKFSELVQELTAENLRGLTLFGPVLDPGYSAAGDVPASSVLVLGRMDLLLLRRLAEHGPFLGRSRIAAPLVMTPDYIAESRDTFPLELLEIHQRHETLLGEDHFARLELDDEHLRLQCEREMKRILIRLRQGLLAAEGRDDFLVELERDIALHLLRTIRGLLWLKGQRDFQPADRTLVACAQMAGRPLVGIRAAVQPDAEGSWDEFTALYHDAEALAALAG